MSFFKKTISSLLTVLLFLSTIAVSPLDALTTREEKALAEEFLKAVYAHYTVIDDPVVNQYINELGENLTRNVPRQPFGFRFHVIQEDTFNAFAGPGGNIFIFSGLIEAMSTENELAAIMAHEIAHVTLRHIPEMIERSKRTGFATMAGVIAGILVGLGGAPTAGTALSMGSLAAGQTISLAYSRENELQADFFGRKYLVESGFHEYGILSALKKIRAQEWFGEDEIPTYLKTHPASAERIAMLGSIMREEPEELRNTYAFDKVRMHVIALYAKRSNSLNRLSTMARNNPDDPAVQYGYGLALSEGGNPDKGVLHIKKAVSLKTDDAHLNVALGRALFLAGDNTRAMEVLEGIDNIAQYGHEGLFSMGRVQMEKGDNKAAVKTFKKLLEHFPEHTQSLFFMGQALGREENFGEAHYYLGRFHRAQGDLENARFHFNKALSETQHPEKKAEIENRIKHLESTWKEEQQLRRRQEREKENQIETFFLPQRPAP